MAFEIGKLAYSGTIKELSVGPANRQVKIGGETALPFYIFEGVMPNPPRVAFQVMDKEPEGWAPAALEPWRDVIQDPAAWALKAQDAYQADLICLWLASTDPNGLNRSPQEAAVLARKVAEAVKIPLIVWGCDNDEKNAEVLRAVAEACEGKNLILGPVTDKNYKQLGAVAIAYKHTVAASSPIDVNLAKQLNILLTNLGVPVEQIVIDPSVGGLGYGLEYAYSVMERIRLSALTQNDEKLQFPILCNIAEEVWKVKEVKQSAEDAPLLGEAARRGITMEALTALTLTLAGAELLIMRHPEAARYLRKMIADLSSAQ